MNAQGLGHSQVYVKQLRKWPSLSQDALPSSLHLYIDDDTSSLPNQHFSLEKPCIFQEIQRVLRFMLVSGVVVMFMLTRRGILTMPNRTWTDKDHLPFHLHSRHSGSVTLSGTTLTFLLRLSPRALPLELLNFSLIPVEWQENCSSLFAGYRLHQGPSVPSY